MGTVVISSVHRMALMDRNGLYANPFRFMQITVGSTLPLFVGYGCFEVF